MADNYDYDAAIWAYYRYAPSLAAAVLFAVLFFIVTAFMFYQIIRHKSWYFSVFAIGGLFEVVGYAARAYEATETPNWTLVPYIIATAFPLVAPALFAASIYMTLGRMIRAVGGQSLAPIRVNWMTKIFVSGDVISFLLQAGGAGYMAANTLSALETGENIIVGGLALQLLYFGIFVLAAGLFHYRLQRRPQDVTNPNALQWQKHMNVLYAASILIFIRSVFRLVEYAGGNDGYLMRHEAFTYCLDALLMFAVMITYCIVTPHDISDAMRKRASNQAEDSVHGKTEETSTVESV